MSPSHIFALARPVAVHALLRHPGNNILLLRPKHRPARPHHVALHLRAVMTRRTDSRRRRDLQVIGRVDIHRPQRRQRRLRALGVDRAPRAQRGRAYRSVHEEHPRVRLSALRAHRGG